MLMDIYPEFQWHRTKDKKVMRPLSNTWNNHSGIATYLHTYLTSLYSLDHIYQYQYNNPLLAYFRYRHEVVYYNRKLYMFGGGMGLTAHSLDKVR